MAGEGLVQSQRGRESVTIYKYPINVYLTYVEMPRGARMLTVQLQGGRPFIWAKVDPMSPMAKRMIVIVATGQALGRGEYVGTWQCTGGEFVWHLFDLGEFQA